MLSSCKWDRIECVLKASLSTKEQPLLLQFREGYRIGFNMPTVLGPVKEELVSSLELAGRIARAAPGMDELPIGRLRYEHNSVGCRVTV